MSKFGLNISEIIFKPLNNVLVAHDSNFRLVFPVSIPYLLLLLLLLENRVDSSALEN